MTLHIGNVARASNGVEGEMGAATIRDLSNANAVSGGAATNAAKPDASGFTATVTSSSSAGPAPTVIVSPGPANGPMKTMSDGVVDSLKAVAERRAEIRAAHTDASPEAALNAARDALLPGPAELRPMTSEGPASAAPERKIGVEDAMRLLADTFDYAVETQVVVKSVSEMSKSANSLLKTQ